MRELTSIDEHIAPYITKDGSRIRELMHPARHGCRAVSLAEAVVMPGGRTERHRHLVTEELYHFLAGQGRMTLGGECFPVEAGMTVCIPPGTLHGLENTGDAELVLLCCCAPPYSHDDTRLAGEHVAPAGGP